MITVADQPLMPAAGEQRDAATAGVMTEEPAGHADLRTTGGLQHLLIEVRPVLNRFIPERLRRCSISARLRRL